MEAVEARDRNVKLPGDMIHIVDRWAEHFRTSRTVIISAFAAAEVCEPQDMQEVRKANPAILAKKLHPALPMGRSQYEIYDNVTLSASLTGFRRLLEQKHAKRDITEEAFLALAENLVNTGQVGGVVIDPIIREFAQELLSDAGRDNPKEFL